VKRSELKVGMDVLVDRRRDWQSWSSSERVRVVDVGDWHKRPGFRSYGREPVTIEIDGQSFIIDAISASDGFRTYKANAFIGREIRHNGLGKPKAYLFIHAKGPWDESRAIQKKNELARKAGEKQATERRTRIEAQRADLMQRLGVLGISIIYMSVNSSGEVSISLDRLEALVELAERGVDHA
jgi:hypothetical protein